MAVPLCLESRRRVFFLSPPQRVEVHTISRTCEAVKLLRLTAVRVLDRRFVAAGHSVDGSVDGNWRWIWRASDTPAVRSLWKLDLVAAVSNGGGSVLPQSSSPQPYIFSA
ncbi:hypothetical protein YC2023_011416 [Brassica napus]